MKVALEGPIHGCTDAECREWRDTVIDQLKDVCTFHNPLDFDCRGRERELAEALIVYDTEGLRDSDIVLVMAETPGWGTGMALQMARDMGKYIVCVCSAKDPSPWLVDRADSMVPDLPTAIAHIRQLTQESMPDGNTRLFLDDWRNPKDFGLVGWTVARTSREAIDILRTNFVVEASLDFHLGYFSDGWEDTGMEVIWWMQRTGTWPPDGVRCHSGDPAGKRRMDEAIRRAYGRIWPNRANVVKALTRDVAFGRVVTGGVNLSSSEEEDRLPR